MSKFAVEALSNIIRTELQKFGFRICVVNPGGYATDIYYKAVDDIKKWTKESMYYKEELVTFNENYNPGQIGRDPAIIALDIANIIASVIPLEAYKSGTEEAKNLVYQANITRLVKLMQSSTKDLDPKNFILKNIENISLESTAD